MQHRNEESHNEHGVSSPCSLIILPTYLIVLIHKVGIETVDILQFELRENEVDE